MVLDLDRDRVGGESPKVDRGNDDASDPLGLGNGAGVVRLDAGTWSWSCVALTYVVGPTTAPAKRTFDSELNSEPVHVMVTGDDSPAVAEVGEIEVSTGTGLLMVNDCEAEFKTHVATLWEQSPQNSKPASAGFSRRRHRG